jgi:hypothetical protein
MVKAYASMANDKDLMFHRYTYSSEHFYCKQPVSDYSISYIKLNYDRSQIYYNTSADAPVDSLSAAMHYTSNPSILRVSIRKTKHPFRLTSNVAFRTLKRIFQFTYQIQHMHITMFITYSFTNMLPSRNVVHLLVLLFEPKYLSCFCTSLGYYTHKNQTTFLKVTWALGVVRSTLRDNKTNILNEKSATRFLNKRNFNK